MRLKGRILSHTSQIALYSASHVCQDFKSKYEARQIRARNGTGNFRGDQKPFVTVTALYE